MGLRFRKSIKLAPGVKLNVGKKSIGISAGGKYGGVSYNTKTGTKARVSAPGTGLSYTTNIDGSNKTSNTQTTTGNGNKNNGCLISCLKIMGILILLGALAQFGWIAGIIWFIFFRKKLDNEPDKQKIYTVIIAILSALSLIFMIVSIGSSSNDNIPSGSTESTISSESTSEYESSSSETLSATNTETFEQQTTEVINSEIETEGGIVSNISETESSSESESETPVVPETEVESESESETTSENNTGKYAVNSKNGKIHMVGACSATDDGANAMESPVYFNTYEEALAYSERIAPNLEKRDCGNCW